MAKTVVVKNPLRGIDPSTIDDIDKVMKDHTIRTLKKWLRASWGPIPVLTGAARATFLKLATLARTRVDIRPRVTIEGRGIPYGLARSAGEIFTEKNDFYGWEWRSELPYGGVLDRKHRYIEAGLRAIEDDQIELPEVKLEGGR